MTLPVPNDHHPADSPLHTPQTTSRAASPTPAQLPATAHDLHPPSSPSSLSSHPPPPQLQAAIPLQRLDPRRPAPSVEAVATTPSVLGQPRPVRNISHSAGLDHRRRPRTPSPPLLIPSSSPSSSPRPPHGLSALDVGAEETVDDNDDNHPTTASMTRKAPPSLRSSPGFSSPSYGAVSQTPVREQSPERMSADRELRERIEREIQQREREERERAERGQRERQHSTTSGRSTSRHATAGQSLRRKRSQATSLLSQYDAVTGGSMRVPPPELNTTTLMSGLGGSRFDVAGTAAPVSAVPSDTSSLSDAKFGDDNDDDEDDGYDYDYDDDGYDRDEYDSRRTYYEHGYADAGGSGSGGSETGLHGASGAADPYGDSHPRDPSRDGSGADSDPPDNSPFAQVRASVAPVDNILLSINTPRMWILSTLFSVLGSSTNLFFSLRYPSVAITPVIALLLVHPLGLAWDLLLKRDDDPPEEFVDGVLVRNLQAHRARLGRLGQLRLWLAQGRWNEKEHTCVYVSSNVSFGFAFATDVIVEQSMFYKQDVSVVYQLLLTLSTQILGYTFAGLSRRFLVRPSGMIWPSTLMSAAMFATLHKEENKPANGWRISRWHFFYLVFLGAFLFYFIPGLLMPALSYFNVVTWFAPDNVVVANLFGVVSGLGLFPLTFDWAQIAYIGSPLLTPFWAAMNVVGGLVVVMWIIAPLAYYSNWLYSSYMPILSAAVFDNRGEVYDVSRILTPDFVFDRAAYRSYSRVFLPITYVLSYGVQFAGLASLLTHTACWHGRDIWRQWKQSLQEAAEQKKLGNGGAGQMPPSTTAYQPVPTGDGGGGDDGDADADNHNIGNESPNAVPLRTATSRSDLHLEGSMGREDVHNRLMKRYRDAPMMWYLITFVSMTAVGMFLVEYYPIHLPWYGLLLALGICAILFIPIGIIMAVTNQHVSIYLICQLVCGAVFPGRPVANMVFVTYGYISSAQGIKFAADLKLGHYMKIPPRILFQVQMAATLVSSVTQIAVLNWMFVHVPGLCTPEALNGFTCPIARVHFNGSILWGVVGPGEFFGPNAIYRPLVWCFLVGVVAPVPLWLWSRHHKHNSIVRKVNLPVLLGSLGWIPPATGLNFSVWALVCYLFNFLVKNRATAWWAKYTMTLSAALDAALASGIVVVFFAFIYPGVVDGFHWWGTEVYRQGCDWRACPYQEVPAGGTFGPNVW